MKKKLLYLMYLRGQFYQIFRSLMFIEDTHNTT